MGRLLAIALLSAAACLLCATTQAQVRMGVGMAGAPFGARPVVGTHPGPRPGVSLSFGPSQRVFHHRFFPSEFFLGEAFLADHPEVITAETPQVIVVETIAAAPENKEEPKPAAPLLIEWQGDHYVRYGAGEQGAGRGRSTLPDYAGEFGAAGRALAASKNELKASVADLPAVLIFRDGRRQEVSCYAIFGGAIYVDSDYWTSGSWSKKIQLAELDLPATFKLNQERGVKFVLPAGPNEVITRP